MSDQNRIKIAATIGLLAAIALLTLYAVIVTTVSGWAFIAEQFSSTWYFIISLALGFGLQVGLYTYLKQSIAKRPAGGEVVAVSGATTTAAMISCCAHYLANLLPILGLVGVVTFVAQYQIELFWVGILFNLAGIAYMVKTIFKFKQV